MGVKRVTGIVVTAVGMAIAAVGIAMPLRSGAETWWAPAIVGALIVALGGFVAWAGWTTARST
jgi:hypothetical protein